MIDLIYRLHLAAGEKPDTGTKDQAVKMLMPTNSRVMFSSA